MNKTIIPPKSLSASSNSKSKKTTKDREKRKSQTGAELGNAHNTEKGSPSKEGSTRQYAGISPESICIYAEQSNFEQLTEDVRNGLAEDVNYKLRFIIHDALVRARISGRNIITSNDIDATFETLNINKVYGAPANPTWINFDQGFYYLDDQVVNLVEIAEQESSFMQPGDVSMTRKWLPESKEISKPLKNYFVIMCQAVVGNDMEMRKAALQDIRQNTRIGPIIEWFYHFGYFLLSKDITYDCLTLYALELIEALERSHVAAITVTEKQLKLLVRLILQRLLKSVTTPEVLKPMCHILAILCERIPLKELVMTKIIQKMPEIQSDFPLPIIMIINSLGIEAVLAIFIPNMYYFLEKTAKNSDSELTYNILATYNILCKEFYETNEIYYAFHSTFFDDLIIYWQPFQNNFIDSTKEETNWVNVKKMLLKTRRSLNVQNTTKKYNFSEIFPDNIHKYTKNKIIEFKFHSFSPVKARSKAIKLNNTPNITFKSQGNNVIVGKTSLLLPVLKNFIHKTCKTKCYDHSLQSYNL